MRDKDPDKPDHIDDKEQYSNLDKSLPESNRKNLEVELAKEMINAYREKYADIDPKVLFNLIELKEITKSPKQPNPDGSFFAIKQRLGIEESNETLRQERWPQKISCPACGSRKIRKNTKEEKSALNNCTYQCQACFKNFNAETGTPLETGTPPLSTWMFCWYLLGCTDSIQYIATKLGLDLSIVEHMVRQMQKLFKAQQPLTHLMSFEEWSLIHGKSYKDRIRNEMATKQELYSGENPNMPKDTAEYRRQKTRARDPKDNTPHRIKPKNRSS